MTNGTVEISPQEKDTESKMPKRESYAHGTPSWVDLSTSDQAAAKSFTAGCSDGRIDDRAIGDNTFYSMASMKGDNVAAIAPQQPEQVAAGVPPHWQMYITVDDVDKAAALVEGSWWFSPRATVRRDGCRPDGGRDRPSGAFFMLWTAKTNIGAEPGQRDREHSHGRSCWPHPTTRPAASTRKSSA